MIKVFIITQDEPFYIPKMIKHLIEKQFQNKYTLIGYTVLSPNRKNKSIFHWISERLRIYSLWEVFLVGTAFTITKILTWLKIVNYYSCRNIFRNANIEEIYTHDINDENYINGIKQKNPDIILSISCPQLFKENLLNTPNIYCMNAHGTLLPRHRGVFGSFWTLYDGDKEGGSTLHTMELKLDAGEIICQDSFIVDKNDTQFSIAYKTKKQMALSIAEVLGKHKRGVNWDFIKPQYSSSYHRAPSRKEGKIFRKNGNKILTFGNLKIMLKNKF
tara:strand:- start:340 stop:1161 length:822 start_codon:yes stop_codon:yes gene_type:complete